MCWPAWTSIIILVPSITTWLPVFECANISWNIQAMAIEISSHGQLVPGIARSSQSPTGQPCVARSSHGQPSQAQSSDHQLWQSNNDQVLSHFLLYLAMAVVMSSYGQPGPAIGRQIKSWAARSSKIQQGQPGPAVGSKVQQCPAKSSHGQSAMAAHPSRSCNI